MFPLTGFWAQTDMDVGKAAILAKGCALAYDGESAADRIAFALVIGAAQIDHTAASGLTPAYTVYIVGANTVIVCFAGTIALSQGLTYWLEADHFSWVKAGSPPISAPINRWIYNLYQTLKASLHTKARLSGTNPLTNPNIIVAGHSLGGGLATMFAMDVLTASPSLGQLGSLYLFGTPRVGGPGINTFFDLAPVYNFRNGDDPIPLWPQDVVHRIWQHPNRLFYFLDQEYDVEYVSLRQCEQIDLNGVTGAWMAQRLDWFDTMQLIASLATTQELPLDHRINNYVNRLYSIALTSSQSAARTVPEVLLALQAMDEIPYSPLATITPVSPVGLPSLNNPIVRTTPAVNGTNLVAADSSVSMTAMPSILYLDNPEKTKRARPGDGRVKRVCKKMRQCMDYIDWHDAAVAAGKRKSTMFLHDPAQWTPELEEAWGILYLQLCGKENGSIGS